jgi:ABC-type Fe3+-siderophore transport system permease subunit
MAIPRNLKIALLVGFVGFVGPEAANTLAGTDSFRIISPAEAVVGRPLTPVSVAGVARRTTRRCAAGVYNC